MDLLAAEGLRLDVDVFDYLILAISFVFVLGVGFAARRAIKTSADFFLSGRSMPAWVTGLAFISANLGALEIIGMPPTAMLVLGGLFLLWQQWRPTHVSKEELAAADSDDRPPAH